MRALADIRARATKLRTRAGKDDEEVALVEQALQLVEVLRTECAGLQHRCTELERQLKAGEQSGRQLFDALPDAIITTDASGIILDANQAACVALSRSRPKLTSDLLLHFVADREAFRGIVRELPRDSAATITIQARFRPTDRAPFDAIVTVIRDPRADSPQWLWHVSRCPSAEKATH
jgi:PAS domain-containing protein